MVCVVLLCRLWRRVLMRIKQKDVVVVACRGYVNQWRLRREPFVLFAHIFGLGRLIGKLLTALARLPQAPFT